MRKNKKSPLAASMGAAFISTLAATSANAGANPFGMSELDGGYMQVAEAQKAGEMKCGANMPGMAMPKPKTPEGACAGNKPVSKPDPKPQGTEGKCGSNMEGDNMKKAK